MELLSFHHEFVAFLSSHEKDNHLITFDIIQDSQVARPQFKLREWVGTQPFYCFRWRRWLILQPRKYG